MLNIVHSTDIIVRSSVARLLIDLCMECESKKCLEILDILERVSTRYTALNLVEIWYRVFN